MKPLILPRSPAFTSKHTLGADHTERLAKIEIDSVLTEARLGELKTRREIERDLAHSIRGVREELDALQGETPLIRGCVDLEQLASGQRPVENLRQGDFHRTDRQTAVIGDEKSRSVDRRPTLEASWAIRNRHSGRFTTGTTPTKPLACNKLVSPPRHRHNIHFRQSRKFFVSPRTVPPLFSAVRNKKRNAKWRHYYFDGKTAAGKKTAPRPFHS